MKKILNKIRNKIENKRGGLTVEWMVFIAVILTLAVGVFLFRDKVMEFIQAAITVIGGDDFKLN